jgi:hypothetical protein
LTLLVALAVAACGGGTPAGSGSPRSPASAASSGRSSAPGSTRAPTDSATASDPASTAAASPAAGATPKPVAAVKGTGFVDSKAFTLKAGNYVVRWRLVSTAAAGCTAIGAIHTPDGRTSVEIANTSVKGKGNRSGSKTASNLPAGSYLVTFATTCSWTANVFNA